MFKTLIILCCISMVLVACEDPVQRPVAHNFNRNVCSSNVNSVTIDELPNVSNKNISDYELSGTCERDRSEVIVNIEGNPISRQPICHQGKWKVNVDMSGIINKKERFQVAVSQGSSAQLLCQQVRNFFVCPENYIAVSRLPYVDSEAFCVMKYEAKVKRGERIPNQLGQNELVPALSLANGDLITRVNMEDAIQFCNRNGPGYTLIHNEEWQAIAVHIERTPYNWSNNVTNITAGNRLNVGHTKAGALSDSNTDDEKSGWNFHKRVHQLANQEYIWDFAGNLWEIVLHNINTLPVKYNGFVYEIPQPLQEYFGPQRDYSIFNTRERVNFFGGLGYIQARRFEGMIIRGGALWNTAGIFSVNSERTANGVRRSDVGFRCVFHP